MGSSWRSVTTSWALKPRGNRVFTAVQEQNGFITITEGLREVTVIVEEENFGRLRKALSSRPKIVHRDYVAPDVPDKLLRVHVRQPD